MKRNILLINAILFIMIYTVSCNNQPVKLFAGRFVETGEKGLCLFDLNRQEGTFKLLTEADAGPNPSYFCISKKKGLIYAANEVMEFNGSKGGGVTTLRFDIKNSTINKLKELVVPDGGPCYISLSPNEDFLLFASYSSGSVAVVKLDDSGIPVRVTDTIKFTGENGRVSHPHMISFNPAGKKVYLTDLGLDRIVIYDFDSDSGHLKQVDNGIVSLSSGSGPRHFTFNSAGTGMYVICELNSTVTVFDVDADGLLRPVQTLSTLDKDFKGESFCADIHLGKRGQFLYGSNRGENTIVVFRVGTDQKLTLVGRTSCGGNWPRNFVIDPPGKFILVGNQKSGNISLLKIDERTGLPVEPSKNFKLNAPACLKFIN